jgi:hypothetical protein
MISPTRQNVAMRTCGREFAHLTTHEHMLYSVDAHGRPMLLLSLPPWTRTITYLRIAADGKR